MNENELKEFEEKEINRITQKIISAIKESKTLTNRQVNKIIDGELKNDSTYSGLQDWNIHYSKERIKEGVLGNSLLNQGKGDSSLSWFNFYVYFRLPAGIIVSFLFLFSGGLIAFLNLIDIAIGGTLFWGLKERKLWAYKMNFVVLIAETVLRPLERANDMIEFVIFIAIFGLLWLLPNWIYFKKRKYLFLYSYGNKEDSKNNRKKWNINAKEKFTRFHNFINKNKIAILIILILVALFYWFELRPSQIRKECASRYPAVSNAYKNCITQHGLKN